MRDDATTAAPAVPTAPGGSAGAVPPLSERAYRALREMAMTYRLPPGQRLNEGELARRLAVSRTPLREALHRLVSEGLLTARAGRGFFARPLDVKEVFDLYETRLAVESATVALAAERGAPASLGALREWVERSAAVQESAPVETLLALDEGFHERVAEAAGNAELLRLLRNVNARVHFVRWIDMSGRRDATQADHRAIVEAIAGGDAPAAVAIVRPHIARRLDQIVEVIGEGHARLGTGRGMADAPAAEGVR